RGAPPAVVALGPADSPAGDPAVAVVPRDRGGARPVAAARARGRPGVGQLADPGGVRGSVEPPPRRSARAVVGRGRPPGLDPRRVDDAVLPRGRARGQTGATHGGGTEPARVE